MEEEKSEIQEDLGNGGKFKNWLQDNIRIILSILIVATIAAGIYSYSKRTVVPATGSDDSVKVDVAKVDNSKDESVEENNSVVVVGEEKAENKTEKTDNKDTEKLSVNQEVDSQDKKEEEKKEK
ncbi:MAG: hypothetical protein DSY82_01730 [Flavobacteriia bacterium]|nr:MAG: hypothetical protein DSY82_01730 [Flavobacteriia bacterium]